MSQTTTTRSRWTTAPDLLTYDFLLVNTSAGKDSQAMMHELHGLAVQLRIADRLVAVHSDLGRAEWASTRELAREQAKAYGIRLEIVQRPQGDLLAHIEARGMFPSSTARYCTSDHKRGQIAKVMTKLADEWRATCRYGTHADQVKCTRPVVPRWTTCARHHSAGQSATLSRPCRILNCLGMRAQESPARAKLVAFQNDQRNTNGRRHVDIWLPIHEWTHEQVWSTIRESGVRHHQAYDLGMPRLSCVFCIFAPEAALRLAGKHNPELLDAYVDVEDRIGHTFKNELSLRQVRADLRAGCHVSKVVDWEM